MTSAAEADAFVGRLRARYPDARHTCFAYRLAGAQPELRFRDDGEPRSSAGRPILRQIEARDLTNTVVVVTRYFGGTKLGVGGLVRAYGAAAAAVLDEVPVREVVDTRRVVVTYDYDDSGAVQAALGASGDEPASSEYGARVRQVFRVPESRVEEFAAALRDRTQGRVEVATGGE